ncbi:MAG: hypothetical protein HUK19_03350 [Fibrobacter sp.]|nr:hypothetical protein [Fibrobacter sp.]
MKYSTKIFGSLAGVLALSMAAGFAFVGCSDSTSAEEHLVPMTIRAYLPEDGLKTLKKAKTVPSTGTTVAVAYEDTDEEIVVTWQEGDKFDLVINNTHYEFTANSIDGNGNVAKFTGNVPGGTDCTEGCDAVYPSGWNVDKLDSLTNVEQAGTLAGLKDVAVMAGTVTIGQDTTLHFEQKVALVDLTMPNAGDIRKVGIKDDSGNEYFAKFSSAVNPQNVIVAVPPTTFESSVTLFSENSKGVQYVYTRELKKGSKSLEKANYYAFDFSSVESKSYAEGIEVVDMGEDCGGIWAKEDYVKDSSGVSYVYFSAYAAGVAGIGRNVTEPDKFSYTVEYFLRKLSEQDGYHTSDFTGKVSWYAPSPDEFSKLLNCLVSNSDGKQFRYNDNTVTFTEPGDGYWTNARESGNAGKASIYKYTRKKKTDPYKWAEQTGEDSKQHHRLHLIYRPN